MERPVSRVARRQGDHRGTCLACADRMINKNPDQMPPQGDDSEPLGDRGHGDKTWSPAQGEQGISNREGDEDPEAEEETDPSKD